MTGTELVEVTRDYIEETAADITATVKIGRALNASLKKWAARIQRTASDYYFESASLTLSSGTRSEDLPSDCSGLIHSLEDENGLPVGRGRFKDFYINATGTPSKMSIKGNAIVFNSKPSSDVVYTLHYYRVPTVITTNGSTEVDFPKLSHNLLALDAALQMSIRNNDVERIQGLASLRKEAESFLMAELEDRIKGLPRRIRMAWSLGRSSGETI